MQEDNAVKQQELLKLIALVQSWGWTIACPNREDGKVWGFVIGTRDFIVDTVGDQIEDFYMPETLYKKDNDQTH